MRGFRGGTGSPELPPLPPEKLQKYRVPSNIGPDPLKSQSYQASIQCWAIISTPAKRHLNGVSLVGRLWPAYSGIWILFHSKKKIGRV